MNSLRQCGVPPERVRLLRVPGAFEIVVAAKWMAESRSVAGIICLGCVIRGETDHYEHICRTCADGIAKVAYDFTMPVMFGVLTCPSRELALARAGGISGNLGSEVAVGLVRMINALR